MDPLGLVLENFDAIGRWRTSEAGAPIDATDALPDGTRLEGVAGLKAYLTSHQQEFVGTVVEKLLSYSLGRGVEYYDRPAVRTILRESRDSRYSWSSIIAGIATSVPFRMRSAE
jgi:hypothetical protein